MKLEITRMDVADEKAIATMTHRGEKLLWRLSFLDRLEKHTARQRQERSLEEMPTFDIFEQINDYWARGCDATVQDRIFDVYRRIQEAFYHDESSHEMTKLLLPLIAELYEYHRLEDIRQWYNFHSNLSLHPKWDLKEFYTSDNSNTREKTYLKEDYRQLTVLTVAIRAMIPVWGEYITKTQGEKGTTFKEYYAFKLLSQANIIHSPAMERLRIYVEASIPQDKTMESAILDAISSEDYPIWLLSLVVVRRLAVADLRPLDPESHLITFIYRYIGQKVKGHDNSFMGLIKPKQVEGQGQEGENNLSKLEGYKVKQDIAAGDIQLMAFDMSNHAKVIARICPDLPPEILQLSLDSVRALSDQDIQKPQLVLMQWVMKPVLNPRGAEHLNKQQVMHNLAITQAVLWHRGYHELAGLLTATALSNEDEMNLQGTETRTRMKAEIAAELMRLYPHLRKPTKQKEARDANAAIRAINAVAQLFAKANWRLTLPPEWVLKLTGHRNNRQYSTPYDIKIKLAELAVALASRKF